MDQYLRNLQRQAASGDYQARKAWIAARVRAGFPHPDKEYLSAPLSEYEHIQEDYDETFWLARPRLGVISMWCGIGCCGYINELATKFIKPKDFTFTFSKMTKNSKRKTLRTHRDGSRGHNVRR